MTQATNCQLNLTINNADSSTIIQLITDLCGTLNATPAGGNRYAFNVTVCGGTGATIYITRPGYKDINHRLTLANGTIIPIPFDGAWELESETLQALIPAAPTYDQLTNINMRFMGGNIINSPTYGLMPWWDSALAWCDESTRDLVYQCKKQTGETHCIINVPSGGALYNEAGNFYDQPAFGPLDWTNGLTSLSPAFDQLLNEICQNGLLAVIFTGDSDPAGSTTVGKMVAQRILDLGLTGYCVTFPGYDAVFYGWDPSLIIAYGAQLRTINSNIILGIEFNPGHIPLGGGAADYSLTGPMQDFDVIGGEFDNFVAGNGSAGNNFWQIVGRCVNPYIPPADENDGDAGHPPFPFYLTPSARGNRKFIFFETDYPYLWVRVDPSNQQAVQAAISDINQMKQYAVGCGVQLVG